jgi:hypothetical protein
MKIENFLLNALHNRIFFIKAAFSGSGLNERKIYTGRSLYN